MVAGKYDVANVFSHPITLNEIMNKVAKIKCSFYDDRKSLNYCIIPSERFQSITSLAVRFIDNFCKFHRLQQRKSAAISKQVNDAEF